MVGGSGFYNAAQFLIADQTPEPVGTEDKRVSLFQDEGTIWGVRHEIPTGAKGGGEDVALRVRLGVFRAHDAALDQPADVGMIAG